MVPGTPATSIFSATMQPKPSFASPDHISSQLQSTTTSHTLDPQTGGQIPGAGHVFGHMRAASNGVNSLQDRKKFTDECPSNQIHPTSITNWVRQAQDAFEVLPQPCAPAAASASMSADEIEMLRKQAMGQAVRFGVLRSKDVDRLSRELRALDNRCEYLHKTLQNLSSGHRNLQDRIRTYIRSPRLAQFSRDSLLKQEEALSDLNISIDDWIDKCERAENRRNRVRQKLLEHIAAAILLEPRVQSKMETKVENSTKDIQIPVKHTPLYSTNKTGLAPVAASDKGILEPIARASAESIRIYAHFDVIA
ncbi:hypothetical protein OIDMADRAFT_35010 [Oidiodendron maius Zn]|uniref:Up-regulated during septation protein 1 domain-containing protein n=1 Tax=Oidiodendron maius (strain Zn) TaxID=913774 RepID=A0A0C3CXQ5_OIDMZ|nr:hypothetical protein OIDMADRAFT_35010 [Oidiodendron maius Zn]